MSGASSNAAGWFTLLEPARAESSSPQRPDDPRLGDIIERWDGSAAALRLGRAVIVGFPQDEGVRRNGGRPGAAQAPDEIRRQLHRMTPFDPETENDLTAQAPLDAGNVRVEGSLANSQTALAEVVGGILAKGAVPVVLGGGHETAYGHFLGYAHARRPVSIVNVDAHLDVRPCLDGLGHSGSPFRQAMEHPQSPLPGSRYVCIGANPWAVAREHWHYARDRGATVYWSRSLRDPESALQTVLQRLSGQEGSIYLTVDADAVGAGDVPGVSAPNAWGLPGPCVANMARLAAQCPQVASMDVVEVNPAVDRDHQSTRWAALVVWFFLTGLAGRAAHVL
jgi:formiminoglutamase